MSSRGLEVSVPAEWGLNDIGCNSDPRRPTVAREQGAYRECLTRESATKIVVKITAARLRPQDAPDGQEGDGEVIDTASTRIGTAAAEITRVRLPDGRIETRITSTALDAGVVARGPKSAQPTLARVLATLRTVDVDSAGCRTRPPAHPAWDRADAGPRADPTSWQDEPGTSVSVCWYDRRVLLGSTLLTGVDAAEVITALGRAPAGVVAPEPATVCLPEPAEETPLWLHVRSPGRAAIDVHVRYSGCDRRWVAAPEGLQQPTSRLLLATLGQLDMGWATVGSLPVG